MVLKSASTKWREFKSRLTSLYIVPYLNEPEKMKYPPKDYKFISQDHWTQFVAYRSSPSFLTMRKVQQMKRQRNMYPHRLSRKGYAGLEEELEIIQLKEKVDRGEESISGSLDVLEKALGTKEHGGRVRGKIQKGVEVYIAQIEEKIIAKAKKEAIEEFKAQLMEDKQQPGNGGSCSLNHNSPAKEDLEAEAGHRGMDLEDLGVQQEKVVTDEFIVDVPKQVDAEVGKLESKGQKGKFSDEVIRQYIDATDHKEVIAEEVQVEEDVRAKEVAVEKVAVTPLRRSPRKTPKNIANLEVPVLLAVGSLYNVVGSGTVLKGDPNQLIHGVPLWEGNVRVSVSFPTQENAKVPFPVSDEIVTVRQACGSWVAWPEELVIYTPLSPSEDYMDDDDDEDIQVIQKAFDSNLLREVAVGLPNSLSMLCMCGEEGFKDSKTIQFHMEAEVFGEIRNSYIYGEDVLKMANMEKVTGNIIVIYQRYLYDVLRKYQMLDMFAFVDPALIGGDPACGTIKQKVEYLAGRLKASQPGQLMMVPYNADSHWVLTIIDPENEKVYYLDPIRRRLPLGSCEWKTVVNSAIGKYNEYMRRTSLKAVEWKPITAVPHQPDAIQCGYYVMRYMRDIVEDKDQFNFVTNGAGETVAWSTQDEIDVVRNEWAKFIVSTYV
ncbi:hypothetical protein OROMI_017707 [Orobanche minor]